MTSVSVVVVTPVMVMIDVNIVMTGQMKRGKWLSVVFILRN